MNDLAERIRASLEDSSSDPWFPELTAGLAARTWDSLYRDIGLTPDSYGTERVLSHSVSAPREIITSLKVSPSIGAAAPAISIEALTQECAVKYQEKGVCFYSPDEILHTTIQPCIEDALAIISQVPSLMRTVAALVRSLHVIKSEDADHDVSFSEPEVPFSIFVSVPEKRIANDALRVAEAIVHEAMHLQLTLIDRISSLTISTSTTYFSPWKKTHRKAEGVLQALYVFRVIEQFFSKLATNLPQMANYVRERQKEIDLQIAELRVFQHCDDLTSIGSKLVQRLIDQMPGQVISRRDLISGRGAPVLNEQPALCGEGFRFEITDTSN